MKRLDQIKRVYCIGLGGAGVSAVARLLLERGVVVSGSDPRRSPFVDDLVKHGAKHHDRPDPNRITVDIDLVVTTDDAPADHPERLAAAKMGIPCENFSATLGALMDEWKGRITIAGTNGKSTTTALTGLLLAGAGFDPTVFVGSRVAEFDGNVRFGRGSVFVAEADEYHDHFLNLRPTTAVITNVEPDHLDYFGTVERMIASYRDYASSLPADGVLVTNADDPGLAGFAASGNKKFTYGIDAPSDLSAREITTGPGVQEWQTFLHGERLGKFNLHIPGRFNISNALAAMTAALSVGADPTTFAETLRSFHGVWRRFQVLNPTAATTIVSDYAHHPSAVSATLVGARAFYPGRRLVAVFQPHHRSRLTTMFDDFAKSFSAADETMIVETYSVPGRDVPEAESKTGEELTAAIIRHGSRAEYLGPVRSLADQLATRLRPGDVAIIMGAGDIWTAAESLAKHYA